MDALLNLPIIGLSGDTFSAFGSIAISAESNAEYDVNYQRRNNSPAGNGLQVELRKGGGTTGKWQYDELSSGDAIRLQAVFSI